LEVIQVAASVRIDQYRDVLVPGLPGLPLHFLARPRLDRLIEDSLAEAPVVALVAPVAFGKTAAVMGWARTAAAPHVAYLALDDLDNDPVWFWSRVSGALRTAPARLDLTEGEITASRHGGPILARLRAALAGARPTVLVLDDLHALTEPAVIESLGDILLHLPPSLKIILASRSELPFRVGLLRARDRLAEIPSCAFAFQPDELAAFFEGFDDVQVTREQTAALASRTEGWVGAARLAAIALAGASDPAGFIRAFNGTNRYVNDLLQGEVLAALPTEVQEFLLLTSVLDVLDPRWCDAVTGRADSEAILERLFRAGLFIEPLDDLDGPPRYRYRRLFRDFLRHELHLLDPDRERRARRAAAGWFEVTDDIAEAISQLLAAGEVADAIQMLLRHGERFVGEGATGTIQDWLAALPGDALVDDLQQLLAVVRLCLSAGLRDEATFWLERARWRLASSDDRELLVELAYLTATQLAQAGHLERAASEAQRTLVLARRAEPPDQSMLTRVHQLLGGVYTALDDFEAAEEHGEAAEASIEDHRVWAAYAAWRAYRQGRLGDALALADDVLSTAAHPWPALTATIARAAVDRERHHLADAETRLAAAVDDADRWARAASLTFASIELALVRMAQGRAREALDLLAAAYDVTEGQRPRLRLRATEATLWLRAGDLDRALWLREVMPAGPETEVLDIRLAVAQGHLDEASERLRRFTAVRRPLPQQIAATLLHARALLPTDEDGALSSLRRAVELGRGEGFVQVFTDDLPHLRPLVRQLVPEHDDPYVFGLLAAVATPDDGQSPDTAPLLEPLSAREEIVLRYLPTALSNKEIAAELDVSVNTLKTHLKSINRKLRAQSRSGAVAAARARRLI
jgi:LuxR family transcriptional regulator, maltose regulon positive regulatory protein